MRSRSSRTRLGDELGAIAAELVTAIPAALAVVALCIAAVTAAATQVELESTAAHTARAAARGDDPGEYARGAEFSVSNDGALVCATVSRTVLAGALVMSARSCADARGW
ncbi:MAG TPA: hypothetical protein H9830_09790 [Candidatus Agrococcus pullicola]|uniref:TadE-like protein n=1 Tax=Candidatus Agrococcus pullicola TaxID=2838429 RepID=A0A9D1YWW5_9MICO|nr:hypothetical protein [Candidatus Agrococcus pullicola]